MHDPSLQALRRAARVTVVATLCFTLGKYVLHDAQLTVLATFTAVALVGIADFGGTRAGRTRANLAAVAAGLVLVPVGTLVSRSTWQASLSMFVIVLAVAFSGIFGGYFTAGANAVILFFVVASGIPAPASAIPARLEGLAIAGAMTVVATVGLWPLYLRDNARSRLGDLLAATSGLLAGLSADQALSSDELARRQAAVRERLLKSRTYLNEMFARRPPAPTAVDRAQMYLLHGVERMDDVINRLIDTAAVDVPVSAELRGAWRKLMAILVRTLDDSAQNLQGRGDLPELDPVVTAKEEFRTLSERALAELMVGDVDHDRFATKVECSLALRELGTATQVVAANTRILAGDEAVLRTDVAGPAALQPAGPGEGRAWHKWARRARANLTLDSIHLRNSIRLAAGLTFARIAVGALDLQHGFWVVFATLTILKTTASNTRATAAEALAGTLVGFGAAAGLALAFGGNGLAYTVVLPFIIFAAFYTGPVVNFVVGQACFTVLIVVLFNILQPQGWTVGLVRLEDVAAGAAIGVATALLAWPRGATGQLKTALADLIDAGRAYAARTARALLPGVPEPRSAEELRIRALRVAVRTEDVFAQYLAERKETDVPPRVWAEILTAGQRLWYSADVMGRMSVAVDAPCRCSEFVRALEDGTSKLSGGYQEVAAALRSAAPVGEFDFLAGAARHLGPSATRCAVAMSSPSEPAELTSAVHLFELRAWLAELSDDLRRLDELVRRQSEQNELPTVRQQTRI